MVRCTCMCLLALAYGEHQGYLCNRCFHPRGWCTRTSNHNKELDQASKRTNLVAICLTRCYSIIFCEVVAIYGVVRRASLLELRSGD